MVWSHSAHAQLSVHCNKVFVCACDQHRANQHCPDRGQGSVILLE
ncbi:unnamed protein product [Staurois parvus]|uniref:Uncharacterized protein n=1 Tax=Staurois parvus TaxID=386267 RepID=A0ABN9HKC5_9NEOB|nr:unnamed protein product [Staurois parvus]